MLANLTTEGSEASYYEAVKLSSTQEAWARISTALLKIPFISDGGQKDGFLVKSLTGIWGGTSAVIAFVELVLLSLLGLLNNWGSSIARVAVLGVVIWLSFSLYYIYADLESFDNSSRKSAEIMFLFGYSVHVTGENSQSAVTFYNAILGLLWYVVAIPTIVNKLTRVRG